MLDHNACEMMFNHFTDLFHSLRSNLEQVSRLPHLRRLRSLASYETVCFASHHHVESCLSQKTSRVSSSLPHDAMMPVQLPSKRPSKVMAILHKPLGGTGIESLEFVCNFCRSCLATPPILSKQPP